MIYIEMLRMIQRAKIMVILRGDFRGKWTEIADALMDGGLSVMEVTYGCPDAVEGIKAIKDHVGDRMLVGAGTVMTVVEVDQAVAAGAQFIVSPNTDADVIARSVHHDALPVPGAYSPTEIALAHKLGGALIKVFPSMPIGPSYIKNLRGPMPNIPMICTGGITIENALEFLNAGADAVGLTGALVTDDVHQFGGLARLRERAQRASDAIQKLQRV